MHATYLQYRKDPREYVSKTPTPTISANSDRKAPLLSVLLYCATNIEQLADAMLVATPHTTLSKINTPRLGEKAKHSQPMIAGKPEHRIVCLGPNLPPQ